MVVVGGEGGGEGRVFKNHTLWCHTYLNRSYRGVCSREGGAANSYSLDYSCMILPNQYFSLCHLTLLKSSDTDKGTLMTPKRSRTYGPLIASLDAIVYT